MVLSQLISSSVSTNVNSIFRFSENETRYKLEVCLPFVDKDTISVKKTGKQLKIQFEVKVEKCLVDSSKHIPKSLAFRVDDYEVSSVSFLEGVLTVILEDAVSKEIEFKVETPEPTLITEKTTSKRKSSPDELLEE
jgi:HSP20 family molecular chaperone IbpA